MQIVQVPVSVQPPQDLTLSDHFLRTRRIILGLTILLILNYLVILVPLDFSYFVFHGFVSTLYNILELACFFGCKVSVQKYSYCIMLTFRIIFVIRDFVFFIPYCILTLVGEFHVAYTVSLVFAMGLNIAIMVIYGKLMRCEPTAYTQRTFLYTN